MMKRRFAALLACLLAAATVVSADEGMWLPSLIGRQVKDMKAKGFRLSAKDIYDINRASLKDAIVLFDRGCTGELVSEEGLLLTNHHCGYGQVQSHSSLEHDYLTNGFWAMNRAEELPNPGLEVSFLVRMDDVTDRVLEGVTDGMDPQARKERIAENSRILVEETLAAYGDRKGYEAAVESMYYGNQYFLFTYRTFRDVRLVGAPPSSIGKFGGDTDNWMWPRHTGDFSVFRIYADADNQPADYSPENVPYRPEKHFTISTRGIDEGDFTFVYGFPGTTREYVTSDYVDYVLNDLNPNTIRMRTERLDIIGTAMEADPAVRIKYASKAAMIANAWKKWQGESLGLARLGTVDKKRAYEARLAEWMADRPEYAGLLDRMHAVYDAWRPYALANSLYRESIFTIELLKMVQQLETAMALGKSFPDAAVLYKDYEPAVDRQLAEAMIEEFVTAVPTEFVPQQLTAAIAQVGGVPAYVDYLFAQSAFATRERYEALCALDEEAFVNTMAADPAVALYSLAGMTYNTEIVPEYQRLSAEIDALYPLYMRAQMAFEPERNFYPDANLTLRVAYGSVEGYRPEDGIYCLPFTTLEGIIAKDNPAIYDYDVPDRLRALYDAKDYGRWAINVGTKKEPFYTVPVAFIATNHTTGGNSGSPVLNGRGELIGINFDRTWLSTMSDLEFDPAMCRNIAVDIRYVLFVIDKVCGAGYLLDEMTIR